LVFQKTYAVFHLNILRFGVL
jgi:serine/threonine protein kinase